MKLHTRLFVALVARHRSRRGASFAGRYAVDRRGQREPAAADRPDLPPRDLHDRRADGVLGAGDRRLRARAGPRPARRRRPDALVHRRAQHAVGRDRPRCWSTCSGRATASQLQQATPRSVGRRPDAAGATPRRAKSVADTIVELVPRNPLDSAVRALDGEMLPLMIFALIFGVAVSATAPRDGAAATS